VKSEMLISGLADMRGWDGLFCSEVTIWKLLELESWVILLWSQVPMPTGIGEHGNS